MNKVRHDGAYSDDSVERVSLSAVASAAELTVLRDFSFSTLGFVSFPLPGMLGFAENERFLRLALRLEQLAGIVTLRELAHLVPEHIGLAVASDPSLAFSKLHNHLALATDFYGALAATQIADDTSVHPRAYVADGGVQIGRGSRIAAHSSVLAGSTLAEGVAVHEGAVVGGVGLQVDRSHSVLFDLEHAGGVQIGKRTQVMANSVIARGLFRQSTVLGADVRIGNLAFVSHNVVIGRGTIVGHGVTINGNVRIGQDVWVGPGSTIANGVQIGDGAQVTLGSVVVRNVPAGARVSGNFSMDHRVFMRRQSRP